MSATISDRTSLDPAALQSAMDGLHRAGMPGVYAEVRDADQVWRGASGVADVETGRPVSPDLRHRVGSVTKTFTAAAVLRQVEKGLVQLDAPIRRYLPRLVPGGRGDRITVRMLLNHTSGIAEYLPYAFPSFRGFPSPRHISPESLDDNRFTRFRPAELIKIWGHDGTTWGAGTLSLTRADGARQASIAINLMRWNTLDAAGKPRPHPIDGALATLRRQALCDDHR